MRSDWRAPPVIAYASAGNSAAASMVCPEKPVKSIERMPMPQPMNATLLATTTRIAEPNAIAQIRAAR